MNEALEADLADAPPDIQTEAKRQSMAVRMTVIANQIPHPALDRRSRRRLSLAFPCKSSSRRLPARQGRGRSAALVSVPVPARGIAPRLPFSLRFPAEFP